MIDLTKPVQLRNGMRAEVWKADGDRLIGRFHDGKIWHFGTWGLRGQNFDDHQRPHDLINIPETKVIEGFVSVY